MRAALCAAALCVGLTQAAFATELTGDARASDGHTLVVRGTRVALLGMTPFGSDDACGPASAAWPCHDATLRALSALVANHRITCDLVNKVGHGDFQGSCRLPDGTDVARGLVAAGWARAADATLAAEEAAARSAGRGAWGVVGRRQ